MQHPPRQPMPVNNGGWTFRPFGRCLKSNRCLVGNEPTALAEVASFLANTVAYLQCFAKDGCLSAFSKQRVLDIANHVNAMSSTLSIHSVSASNNLLNVITPPTVMPPAVVQAPMLPMVPPPPPLPLVAVTAKKSGGMKRRTKKGKKRTKKM